jgi:hypothetical protein
MSSAKINISQLPTADEVTSSDYFIVDDTVTTKKVEFNNIIFGLNNVTFASTISSHSTEIATISSNLTQLSAQEGNDVLMLEGYVNTGLLAVTASFINIIYPVGAVMYTANSPAVYNPNTSIPGTTWTQIAQGLFIAGVGTNVAGDKNGDSINILQGLDNGANSIGEYNHTLTINEIPAHNHQPPDTASGTNYGLIPTSVTGASVTPSAADAIDSGTQPNILATPKTPLTQGGGSKHNNVPPMYGLYIWQRTA